MSFLSTMAKKHKAVTDLTWKGWENDNKKNVAREINRGD